VTTFFYARLARKNIVNNRKIYLPYILTAIGMVMMFYIVGFLASDPEVSRIAGGEMLQALLSFGVGVIGVFATIFLIYTNSFLMKRRKKELGLFNILGMGKRHIAKVILWESGYVAAISIAAGLLIGILLSKLNQMVMLRLVEKTASLRFGVSAHAVVLTAVVFVGIFLLLLAGSLRQVHVSSPIELLRGGDVGEREPKANYALALLGLILLGGGYFLALSVQDPVSAMLWFFVAVILVILGTYLLFISGSVALLKALRRNKRYYYKLNHFISVSGMFYRMKRNGAGLASICILSTMVLVMISTTTCLYVGAEDAMRSQYPRDVGVSVSADDLAVPPAVDEAARAALKGAGAEAEGLLQYRYFSCAAYERDGALGFDGSGVDAQYRSLYVVSLPDYPNRANLALNPGEIAVYASGTAPGDTLSIGGETYRVRHRLSEGVEGLTSNSVNIVEHLLVVMPTDGDVRALYERFKASAGPLDHPFTFYYGFDLGADRALQAEVAKEIRATLDGELTGLRVDSTAEKWDDFIGIYGGLLFLGFLLGFTFVVAAALIMYYKQVTEGYEDNERFDILKRVGMTVREIRAAINSQVLTVFALPLAAAACHMAFAFPMVAKMLRAFGLNNVPLFMMTSAATFVVFALMYALAYRATSKAYLGIVGGMNGRIRT